MEFLVVRGKVGAESEAESQLEVGLDSGSEARSVESWPDVARGFSPPDQTKGPARCTWHEAWGQLVTAMEEVRAAEEVRVKKHLRPHGTRRAGRA